MNTLTNGMPPIHPGEFLRETLDELGLTQEEVSSLPADELEARKADVRRRMLAAGAHYVVDTIAELPAVIAEINRKLEIL